jgi:hypothetical protein
MSRIPQPIPSAENPGHYDDVFKTPLQRDNGTPYEIDAFAPRANLKKMFKRGNISSKDHDKLLDFSQKHIVDLEALTAYVKHLESLKIASDLKATEEQSRKLRVKRNHIKIMIGNQ